MESLRWHYHFLRLAAEVASMSKDPSTKHGAVIVRPDSTVAAMGFNGFPRQMEDREEWLSDRAQKYPRVIHAEMNALLHLREPAHGYTAYVTGTPCSRCAVHLIQAGIKHFCFYEDKPEWKERWGEEFDLTAKFLRETGCDHMVLQRS